MKNTFTILLLLGACLLSGVAVAQNHELLLRKQDGKIIEQFSVGDHILLYTQGNPDRIKGKITRLSPDSVHLYSVLSGASAYTWNQVTVIGRRRVIHTALRGAGLGLYTISSGMFLIGTVAFFSGDDWGQLTGILFYAMSIPTSAIATIPFLFKRSKYTLADYKWTIVEGEMP